MNTRKLTLIAVVAALYVVLTVSLGMLGYGPIQFRVSEILNLLALIHPIYIFAVGLGCAISNFYAYGIIDVVVGSISTMIAMALMYKFRKNIFVASLFPTIMTFPIAVELNYLTGAPLWETFAFIALSEFIIVTVIGIPVYNVIKKNKRLMEILSLKKF